MCIRDRWTPIPCITCCCPCVGHMGICDSNGVIYDFAGPYRIGKNQLAFGDATRVLQLDPSRVTDLDGAETHMEAYDNGLVHANSVYAKRMHRLCCDNCHSHVAMALEKMGYRSCLPWNMATLACWMCWCARYVSCERFVKSVFPSLIGCLAVACLIIFLLIL
eukprot:TRINITY_DN26781_c0_g1_i1.p1 TRINITY_DN26781_c0_g1~~TRINITY_DN26781_c0_g1_i1.p1  ORF type:complete len:163 (-),score=16.19 TRINITY_DN26781_c0_g1_i1:91-579(-)